MGLAGGIRIVRWQSADAQALQGCLAVLQAAQAADDPAGRPTSGRALGSWLGRGGDPGEAWFTPGPTTGVALGWYRLELPDLENRDRAALHVVVHPQYRRQGAGRTLLRHATERAEAAGRTVLDGEVRDGSPGDAFAAGAGATPGIAADLRVLDLRTFPSEKFAGLRARAARAAAGYSLVTWAGPTPEAYLERMAALFNAFGDAPRDADVQAETWDAQRVRERADGKLAAMGVRGYTVAAVHDASGELAAMTQLMVDPEFPRWARQSLTTVILPHRGHRLGLLIKTAMLDWLAVAEPTLELIETGNAAGNSHMIAVNDALGYEVRRPAFHTVELSVADVLGARPRFLVLAGVPLG
jgi:GNAT superfamily N-acetyltransferase